MEEATANLLTSNFSTPMRLMFIRTRPRFLRQTSFSPKTTLPNNFDSAARSFVSKLRNVFKSDTLIWLVPDFLNDFELEITRRNLNARFPDAEPLPRSVAAVFEQVDYSKNHLRNSYPIVVVDSIGGTDLCHQTPRSSSTQTSRNAFPKPTAFIGSVVHQ